MVILDSIPSYISYIGHIPVISPVRSDVSGVSMLGVEFCGVSPEAQPDANAAEVLLLTRKLLEGEGPAHCTRLAETCWDLLSRWWGGHLKQSKHCKVPWSCITYWGWIKKRTLYIYIRYIYIHTYVHTYIHKYIHTYLHTYIQNGPMEEWFLL